MRCDAPNGLTEPFWTFCQVLSLSGAKTYFIFFSRCDALNGLTEPFWTFCQVLSSFGATWQNVKNGSFKPFGASQLILSERKNAIFSLRMSSKLDKTFRMAQLSHWEHHSVRKKWNMFSLRISSKLDKTFRTAQLSHLEHRISFWARKNNDNLFRCEWAQNLRKRSERLS